MTNRTNHIHISDYSDLANPVFHHWTQVNASFILEPDGLLRIYITEQDDDESV